MKDMKMSTGPDEVQAGLSVMNLLTMGGGLLLTAYGYIFRRTLTRIKELENANMNNVKKEDYNRDIAKLESGMKNITDIFLDQHQIIQAKIDSNA